MVSAWHLKFIYFLTSFMFPYFSLIHHYSSFFYVNHFAIYVFGGIAIVITLYKKLILFEVFGATLRRLLSRIHLQKATREMLFILQYFLLVIT